MQNFLKMFYRKYLYAAIKCIYTLKYKTVKSKPICNIPRRSLA